MISSYAPLPDLVIPSGSNVSEVFNGVYVFHDANGVMLYSPTGLTESIYFEVHQDQLAKTGDAGWCAYETFDSTGTSINMFVPGAGKAQVYQEPVLAGSFRLKSATNVGADRVFKCNKLWTT